MKTICNRCNKEKEGIQTGLCNNCGKFGKTDRELAIEWWNSLGDNIGEIADKYNRGCETITNKQIEEIWIREKKTKFIKFKNT